MTKLSTGVLSQAAAKRIGTPHLAGQEVQYDLHPKNSENNVTVADNVYFQGERIAGTVSVGTNGIQPLEQQAETLFETAFQQQK